MELIFVIALICLGVAAQPFASRRLAPGAQSVLGSLCVGVSLVLTMLIGGGLVQLPEFTSAGRAFAAPPDAEEIKAEEPKAEQVEAPASETPAEVAPAPLASEATAEKAHFGVLITTTLKGTGAEKMEASVTKVIEEAVNTIPDISEVKSTTKEGLSRVVVAFKSLKDGDGAVRKVRDKVAAIMNRLPAGTETPAIDKSTGEDSPAAPAAENGKQEAGEVTEGKITEVAKSTPVPNDETKFFVPPAAPVLPAEEPKIATDDDDTVIIPPGRPGWVGQAAQREGSIQSTAVCSDPYATHQQALRALDRKLEAATQEYISQHLHSELAPHLLSYDLAEIKRKLLPPRNVYHEKIQVSIGPMHQVHALVEFNPDFREELDHRWGEMRATYRLAETGLIGGGVLLVLATIFGYFRLDNATRGYYTSRLQFMAAAAILAIVASSAMISKWWIYWL